MGFGMRGGLEGYRCLHAAIVMGYSRLLDLQGFGGPGVQVGHGSFSIASDIMSEGSSGDRPSTEKRLTHDIISYSPKPYTLNPKPHSSGFKVAQSPVSAGLARVEAVCCKRLKYA